MDGGARAAQSVAMNATNVVRASERNLQIVDLLRDGQTLGRLRRIHYAFGEALREEQMFRELDWLLYER